MKTRTFRISDAELACHEVPGSGRPFVMLHGLTGHRDDFVDRLPDLPQDVRWLAPDLRGHGDFTPTDSAGKFGFEPLVADLVALLDARGAERCDLLGHSFGGMVALRFALAHPARLASLVLMSTGPFAPVAYDADTFRKAGAIARARGMAFLHELVEERWHERDEGADPTPARWGDSYWEHHRKRYTAMDPAAYEALGLLMVQQTPVTPRLGEIRCPTTVIVGEDDAEFLPGAQELARGIPGAEYVLLRGAGHHPHMENPVAWLDVMRGHLARGPARFAIDIGPGSFDGPL